MEERNNGYGKTRMNRILFPVCAFSLKFSILLDFCNQIKQYY